MRHYPFTLYSSARLIALWIPMCPRQKTASTVVGRTYACVRQTGSQYKLQLAVFRSCSLAGCSAQALPPPFRVTVVDNPKLSARCSLVRKLHARCNRLLAGAAHGEAARVSLLPTGSQLERGGFSLNSFSLSCDERTPTVAPIFTLFGVLW